jgi:hypothetical protein
MFIVVEGGGRRLTYEHGRSAIHAPRYRERGVWAGKLDKSVSYAPPKYGIEDMKI